MKITLNSNPKEAPGCLLIINENGDTLLIQTDWEWPGVANAFGWNMLSVQRDYSQLCNKGKSLVCEHRHTDGTVDCPDCGVKVREFIASARQWLDENDGAETDDPGYAFDAAEPTEEENELEDLENDLDNAKAQKENIEEEMAQLRVELKSLMNEMVVIKARQKELQKK
jgi:hypothetical protein